ncbi:MAG TPA: GTP-binding protein [Candidatus Absconditabacterales bacterium]|nr:GTP-binding protein [Candidatus Absconditabacterales bacterium]
MKIRNFCIIAHIDHGKSTLADRMLEITDTIRKSDKNQVLDRMDLEQERGITIKLTPARMQRKGYEFNLIDTPGHVDFQYEVSRSLASVEGAILLVDASQGIQAQTLSTLYQAMDQNIEIIPVLNKIDLPAADPDRVGQEIENIIGIDRSEILAVSGKTGQNVEQVLDMIIEKIQDPETFKKENEKKFYSNSVPLTKGEGEGLLSRALIFDSVYDTYKGVLSYIKVIEGEIKAGEKIVLANSKNIITPTEVGYFSPDYSKDDSLKEGQIGYIVTGEKSVRDAQIGDTLLSGISKDKLEDTVFLKSLAIPGFRKSKPFVYAGVYPIDTTEYDKLKDSLEKLSLNDSSIEYTMEDSKALGLGFRCGFLGMLHMDIIKERLLREFKLETIFTTPTVVYLVKSKNLSLDKIKSGANIKELIKTGYYKHILKNHPPYEGGIKGVQNLSTGELIEKYSEELKPRMIVRAGSDITEQGIIEEIYEPMSEIEIVGPQEFAGEIMNLCQNYRGEMRNMEHLDETRVVWKYLIPMGEIIVDFYDKLKSATKGYATMNYEFQKYRKSDLVKLDMYLNNEKIEALSMIVHKDSSYHQGREIAKKLKELIPRHMFVIPIQAGIGNKMIARENIPALKKDVIAKCYGGDVSRKRKLLQKQKEGKKKMKAMGSVNVPGDVFIKMVAK